MLVVDDDELLAESVRAVLETDGHVVGVVNGGQEALTAIAAARPDLVILDAMMPEVPGSEVLHQVRTSASAWETPILMLTARRSEADVEIAYRSGVDDYLKKPFDPDELLFRVEDLLKRKKG